MQVDELRRVLIDCGLVERERKIHNDIQTYILYFKHFQQDSDYDRYIAKISSLHSEPVLTLHPFSKSNSFMNNDKYSNYVYLNRIADNGLRAIYVEFINKWSGNVWTNRIDDKFTVNSIPLYMISNELCRSIVLDIIKLHHDVECCSDIHNISKF